MSDILSRLLEVLARALAWVGLENLASDVLAGLFVEALKVSVPVVLLLITSLRSRLLRRHGERAFRRLRRRGRALLAGRRTASASDPEMERRYLSWLEGRDAEEDWDGPPLPVPAHLSRDRRHPDRPWRRPDEEPVRRRRPRVRDLVRALDGFDTVLVLGEPGSGKSVALRRHARALARAGQAAARPALLPVLADLGQWNAFAKEAGAATVPGFLAWSLRRQAEAREAALYREPLLHLAAQLEELIFQGRTVLLFDSLDELPQDGRGEVLELLRRFVRDAVREGNRVILAGRTLDDAPALGTEILTLAPLERATIRAFLQTQAPTRAGLLLPWLEQDPALLEMAGNPLFLHALAELAGGQERPGAGMPSSRGEVLARAVDRRLVREATEKQKEALAAIPGGTGTLQSFLAQVGFAMQRRRDRGSSVDVREIPALAARSPGSTDLLEIARRARLLEVREGQRETTLLRFTHLRYQELFAARELLRLAGEGTDSALELPLEDLRWEETVLLALDLAAEPREVLHLLTARRQRETEGRDGGDGERLLRLTARALHRLEVRSGLGPADLELSLEVRRQLEGLVNEGDPWGQARSLRTLLDLGLETSLPVVERALGAASPWVREEALTALLGMGVDRPRIRRSVLGVLVRAFGRSLLPLWPRRMGGLGELARLGPVLRKEPGGRGLAALAVALAVVAAPVAVATTVGLGILVAAAGLIFYGLVYLFALPVGMGFLALLFALLPIVARLRPGTWKQSPVRLAPALLDFAVWGCAAFWLPWLWSLTLIFGHALCIGAVWGLGRADAERDRKEPETSEEQLGLLRGAALLLLSLYLTSQVFLRYLLPPALQPSVQPEAALAFAGLGLLQLLWFRRGVRRWIQPWLRWDTVWVVSFLLLSLLPFWISYQFFKFASFDWLRLAGLFFAGALLSGSCVAFIGALGVLVPSLRAIAVLQASRRSSSSHRTALLDAVESGDLPLWLRKRALRALAREVPASPRLLNRLGHLATTELPAVFRDALHRTMDQVESRLRQGREEAGPTFRIRSSLTRPMPWVLLGAAGCLVASLAGAWRLLVPGSPDLALQMALSVPGLAVVCLLGVLATPGRASWRRAAAWITGVGLTAIVVSRPWQERLCAPSAMLVDFGGVFILDAASVYSAGWAVIAGLLGGALGFFLYELESGDAALRQELLSSNEEDSRPVFPLLLLFLAAVVQSPPVAEYLPTASEPLPRFEQSSAPEAVARLAGLAAGGRTVRVALVEAEDPARLPLPLTFPDLEGDRPWRRKTPHTWLERLLPEAGQVRGEVWLVTSEGTPRMWESLPGGCLAVAAAGPDWVELRLRDRCPASDPLGLVAIQYGPRWSREIAARAAPERVRAEIASRRSGRLLADTMSPSVRVVRSGPFMYSGR